MKKLTKKAKQIIRDESLEILKSAKSQVSPESLDKTKQESIESIQKEAEEKGLTPEEVSKLKSQKKARLRVLENEMSEIRRQRDQQKQKWQKEQEELLTTPEPQDEPVEEPASKRPKGAVGKAKGSKARVEKVKFKRERAKMPSG